MFKAFDKVTSYFNKEHQDYHIVDKENQMVRMCLQGDGQVFQVVCRMGELDTVNMTVIQTLKIPKEKMAEACVWRRTRLPFTRSLPVGATLNSW